MEQFESDGSCFWADGRIRLSPAEAQLLEAFRLMVYPHRAADGEDAGNDDFAAFGSDGTPSALWSSISGCPHSASVPALLAAVGRVLRSGVGGNLVHWSCAPTIESVVLAHAAANDHRRPRMFYLIPPHEGGVCFASDRAGVAALFDRLGLSARWLATGPAVATRAAVALHHAGKEPGIRQACGEALEADSRFERTALAPLPSPHDLSQSQPHLPLIEGVRSTLSAYLRRLPGKQT